MVLENMIDLNQEIVDIVEFKNWIECMDYFQPLLSQFHSIVADLKAISDTCTQEMTTSGIQSSTIESWNLNYKRLSEFVCLKSKLMYYVVDTGPTSHIYDAPLDATADVVSDSIKKIEGFRSSIQTNMEKSGILSTYKAEITAAFDASKAAAK